MNALIEARMKEIKNFEQKQDAYEEASREAVAEAMTDILPEASFLTALAEKNQTVFQKLKAKFKEFLSKIKDHFASLTPNTSPEARAVKEQVDGTLRYMKDVVKAFDTAALRAVENYRAARDVDVVNEITKNPDERLEDADTSRSQKRDIMDAETSTKSSFAGIGEIPTYETLENRTSTAPVNRTELQKIRAQSVRNFHLESRHAHSLDQYVMGLSYLINSKLNSGELRDTDRPYIDTLTEAFEKFPTFQGRTYRNMSFLNEQDLNAYLTENSAGSVVTLKAFTSTSKNPNGYPLFGKHVVHMIFDGISGRDIADTYGIPKQQEVVLLPGTRYTVQGVATANDGNTVIFVKESTNHEVQISHRNSGIHGFEPGGSLQGTGSVSQGEKHGSVRVHGDRGGAANAGNGRDSQVRYTAPSRAKPLKKQDSDSVKSQSEISDENGIDQKRDDLSDTQQQRRTKDLTVRDVIAIAAAPLLERGALTPGELDALHGHEELLNDLADLQNKRHELGQLYRKQQFGKQPDREEAKKTRNRMTVMDGKIARAEQEAREWEESKTMQAIAGKAQAIVDEMEQKNAAYVARRIENYRKRGEIRNVDFSAHDLSFHCL